MRRILRSAAPLLLLALLAASCSSSDDGDDATAGSGDNGEGVSTDTDTTEDESEAAGPRPGDLVASEEAEITGLEATEVTYLSTGVHGDLVEVTGIVIAPAGGTDGADIVSWTHGTVGVGDSCAPSQNPNTISEAPRLLAEAGYVVAVTDYEGLGSEGTHPYLVGSSEARSAIDIVRATRALHPSATDRYAVAGLSQGGHAALWAGQEATEYAPDLELVGVVAAAPASGLSRLMSAIGSAAQGFAVMAAYAYAFSYDDIELSDYFSEEAIEAMDVVESGCNAEVFAAFLDRSFDDMVNPAGWDGREPLGPLVDRLVENEVATADAEIAAPVLLVQGEVDAIVARENVEAVQQRYCETGTNAAYELYLGGGHVDTIITGIDDVLIWLDDRFEGVEPVDGCSIVDPDLEAIQLAELTGPAVEGTLLLGATPAEYDNLVSETTAPRLETCPGIPMWGGLVPVAYSASVWVVEPGVGPFLDVFAARFASEEEAAAAIAAFDQELIDCGTFIDPATTAEGTFTRGEDPAIGDESFRADFTGGLGGIPVSRVSLTARVGDTVYNASQSIGFAEADEAVAREALEAILP